MFLVRKKNADKLILRDEFIRGSTLLKDHSLSLNTFNARTRTRILSVPTDFPASAHGRTSFSLDQSCSQPNDSFSLTRSEKVLFPLNAFLLNISCILFASRLTAYLFISICKNFGFVNCFLLLLTYSNLLFHTYYFLPIISYIRYNLRSHPEPVLHSSQRDLSKYRLPEKRYPLLYR